MTGGLLASSIKITTMHKIGLQIISCLFFGLFCNLIYAQQTIRGTIINFLRMRQKISP